MTPYGRPLAYIKIQIPNGTAIQARLCEARAIFLIQTPQVNCLVAVNPTQHKNPKALAGSRDA